MIIVYKCLLSWVLCIKTLKNKKKNVNIIGDRPLNKKLKKNRHEAFNLAAKLTLCKPYFKSCIWSSTPTHGIVCFGCNFTDSSAVTSLRPTTVCFCPTLVAVILRSQRYITALNSYILHGFFTVCSDSIVLQPTTRNDI